MERKIIRFITFFKVFKEKLITSFFCFFLNWWLYSKSKITLPSAGHSTPVSQYKQVHLHVLFMCKQSSAKGTIYLIIIINIISMLYHVKTHLKTCQCTNTTVQKEEVNIKQKVHCYRCNNLLYSELIFFYILSTVQQLYKVILAVLPVVMRSKAAGTPMSLGRRWLPPAAGRRPRVTSGRPTLAWKDKKAQYLMNDRPWLGWQRE